MDQKNEVYGVTSWSRTPSVIKVRSRVPEVFAMLPDLIQEAVVSTEFSSPRLHISRVQNSRIVESEFLTSPVFVVRSRTDSGVDLPDLTVKDEKIIEKYGSDLTANFADIKAHGAKAFFQKENTSNQTTYSLCVCATGYIWVYVPPVPPPVRQLPFAEFDIQIGTFALKACSITTSEIPCRYKPGLDQPSNGRLALFCATVLAKYLRFRMIGKQFEEAIFFAIKEGRQELAAFHIVDPKNFDGLNMMLRRVCINAPVPPESVVSLISRSMINRRWQRWRETKTLRRRYFLPRRVVRCFRTSRYDSIDLLSGAFGALKVERPNDSVAAVQDPEPPSKDSIVDSVAISPLALQNKPLFTRLSLMLDGGDLSPFHPDA